MIELGICMFLVCLGLAILTLVENMVDKDKNKQVSSSSDQDT